MYDDRVHLVRYTPHAYPLDAATVLIGADAPAAVLESVEAGVYRMLKKQADRKVAGAAADVKVDPRAKQQFPNLWDHLTQKRWDDGSARQTSSLLLFEQDGVFKAMLRDREAALCLWVAAQGFFAVFEALEAALCDPAAEWRVDRQQEGQQAKRVRRAS
jgi:hypothetical protein